MKGVAVECAVDSGSICFRPHTNGGRREFRDGVEELAKLFYMYRLSRINQLLWSRREEVKTLRFVSKLTPFAVNWTAGGLQIRPANMEDIPRIQRDQLNSCGGSGHCIKGSETWHALKLTTHNSDDLHKLSRCT